jgi:hypothetical protein
MKLPLRIDFISIILMACLTSLYDQVASAVSVFLHQHARDLDTLQSLAGDSPLLPSPLSHSQSPHATFVKHPLFIY